MRKTTKKTTARKTPTPKAIAKALRTAMKGRPPAEIGLFPPSKYEAELAHHAFSYGAEILKARAAKAKDARTRRTLTEKAAALNAMAKAFEAEGLNR